MELNRYVFYRNARLVVPIALAQCIIYFSLNHFPPFPSRTLPLTWVDNAVPFWPWTMWPYLVMIFGPVVLPLLIRQEKVVKQALWAYILGYTATFAFHGFWPTQSERPEMPEDGTFQSWAYRCLTTLDAPHSCFPSHRPSRGEERGVLGGEGGTVASAPSPPRIILAGCTQPPSR